MCMCVCGVCSCVLYLLVHLICRGQVVSLEYELQEPLCLQHTQEAVLSVGFL